MAEHVVALRHKEKTKLATRRRHPDDARKLIKSSPEEGRLGAVIKVLQGRGFEVDWSFEEELRRALAPKERGLENF